MWRRLRRQTPRNWLHPRGSKFKTHLPAFQEYKVRYQIEQGCPEVCQRWRKWGFRIQSLLYCRSKTLSYLVIIIFIIILLLSYLWHYIIILLLYHYYSITLLINYENFLYFFWHLHFYTNIIIDVSAKDWTCNAVLKRSPGEIASSGYPLRSYPPRSSCTWRLWSSNLKHRIRLDFLYFRLQEHPLGHCTENADHVKVIDGGKVQSPTIGIYCGVMPPFFVISAGKELLVQFRTDSEWKDSTDDRRKGFRASYSFEEEMGLNRTIFERTKDVHRESIYILIDSYIDIDFTAFNPYSCCRDYYINLNKVKVVWIMVSEISKSFST